MTCDILLAMALATIGVVAIFAVGMGLLLFLSRRGGLVRKWRDWP